jgi:hypothetical protein
MTKREKSFRNKLILFEKLLTKNASFRQISTALFIVLYAEYIKIRDGNLQNRYSLDCHSTKKFCHHPKDKSSVFAWSGALLYLF